jgi:site-specific DNA recombinase
VSEPIETGTPMGRAMLKMVLVFAEAEREIIAERMKSGKLKNAQDGKFNGSPIPYGFRRGKTAERDFEVVGEEAQVVENLFREFARGQFGVGTIKRKTGCPLSEAGISELLSNIFYTGRIRYGDVVSFNDHPAIVSDRLFNRVQAVMKNRSKAKSKQFWKVRVGKAELRLL